MPRAKIQPGMLEFRMRRNRKAGTPQAPTPTSAPAPPPPPPPAPQPSAPSAPPPGHAWHRVADPTHPSAKKAAQPPAGPKSSGPSGSGASGQAETATASQITDPIELMKFLYQARSSKGAWSMEGRKNKIQHVCDCVHKVNLLAASEPTLTADEVQAIHDRLAALGGKRVRGSASLPSSRLTGDHPGGRVPLPQPHLKPGERNNSVYSMPDSAKAVVDDRKTYAVIRISGMKFSQRGKPSESSPS